MRIIVASRCPYLPRNRAPSMSFSTSLTVRYSRGRRFAFKSRRGGTVPFTVLGAGLLLLLFVAEIRVFTKGTVPIKALFGTVQVYHAIRPARRPVPYWSLCGWL